MLRVVLFHFISEKDLCMLKIQLVCDDHMFQLSKVTALFDILRLLSDRTHKLSYFNSSKRSPENKDLVENERDWECAFFSLLNLIPFLIIKKWNSQSGTTMKEADSFGSRFKRKLRHKIPGLRRTHIFDAEVLHFTHPILNVFALVENLSFLLVLRHSYWVCSQWRKAHNYSMGKSQVFRPKCALVRKSWF